MTHVKKTSSGFSLIEMLVVLAIMGILLTILVPVLADAKKLGENATCMSNMKQLGTAVMQFQAEKERYPYAFRGANGEPAWVIGSGGPGWSAWSIESNLLNGSIWPYVKTRKLFVCPTFDRKFRDANLNWAHLDAYCTYSLNEYISGGWAGQVRADRNLIRHPARFGIIAEEFVTSTKYARYPINNLAFGPGNFSNRSSSSGSIVDGMAEFHSTPNDSYLGGKTHVTFADGHVELRGPEDTKEIFTPWFVKNRIHPGLYPN